MTLSCVLVGSIVKAVIAVEKAVLIASDATYYSGGVPAAPIMGMTAISTRLVVKFDSQRRMEVYDCAICSYPCIQ